jgi:hypothetical protein
MGAKQNKDDAGDKSDVKSMAKTAMGAVAGDIAKTTAGAVAGKMDLSEMLSKVTGALSAGKEAIDKASSPPGGAPDLKSSAPNSPTPHSEARETAKQNATPNTKMTVTIETDTKDKMKPTT